MERRIYFRRNLFGGERADVLERKLERAVDGLMCAPVTKPRAE